MSESEGLVQGPRVIADSIYIGKTMAYRQRFDPEPVAHVDQDDPCTASFNLFARLCDVGDRFPAEGAAGVPQEYE
jgi:hypothetical protein